jgi:L-fuconate dehydratase
MSPDEFVNCLDFKHLGDALTRQEALDIVEKNSATRAERIMHLEKHGYPAYTTTPGWLGYSDEKMQRLCREAIASGFNHIKLKVGENIQDDIHRCTLAREAVGDKTRLMVDANQAWEVDQAIEWMNHLQPFKPWFIEEPTSPDDIFGHKKIRENIGDIQVATGEHCHNKVMFKQFIANDAIDVVQVDACRLGGLNEILTVFMLAAKFGKPVCPHAGGVGLCEYVQHLSMIDFVQISADIGERVIEYADHLHEHFETPVEIKNGAYMPPSSAGFGVKILPASIERYQYPNGAEWQKRLEAKGV